jgi:hypothetical protein
VRSHVGRTSSKARRYASLAWGLAAFIAVFRREQTPACAVVSLHVEVGVILTAKAPNRRRSLRPFGGRDDAGPRSETQGRENGHDHIARHRPRGAAARRRRILLQTQGLSRTGGSLAGIVRPLTHVHRSHGLSPILAGSATVHVASLRSTYRCTAHSLGTQSFVTRIATPRGHGSRTPVAPTHADLTRGHL